ncbi:hypothetical protein [Yinghuangia seranimata]|uniref:hypothetical protein n=1 Tax=Yinghuangia seranimata TaxID=408067 RepID=UPI00248CAF2A|nr:hypothetical protein [Yinghuangia seranimata]MDI2131050.1 hypothetical protein [Yinghuangia seranimata]
MPTTTDPAASRPAATPVAPAPHRAVWAAHVTTIVSLPAGLWRLSLIAGSHSGYTDAGYHDMNAQGWGGAWMLFLTVGSEVLALLTLSLVRPWGEVVPRWVPRIGGKYLAPRRVARTWTVVGVVLVLLWGQFLLWWLMPHDDMTDSGAFWVGFAYLPTVLWGPLVLFIVRDYRRRHGLTK